MSTGNLIPESCVAKKASVNVDRSCQIYNFVNIYTVCYCLLRHSGGFYSPSRVDLPFAPGMSPCWRQQRLRRCLDPGYSPFRGLFLYNTGSWKPVERLTAPQPLRKRLVFSTTCITFGSALHCACHCVRRDKHQKPQASVLSRKGTCAHT